jgi:hypothetical protein
MTNHRSVNKAIAYLGFVLYFLLLLGVALSLETPAARSHGDSLVPSSTIHSASERSPFDPSLPSSSLLTWLVLA